MVLFYQNLKTEYDKIFGDCLHLGGAYGAPVRCS